MSMPATLPPDLRPMTGTEAAAFLGIDRATLRRWSPPGMLINGRRRYAQRRLLEWLKERETAACNASPQPRGDEKQSPSRGKNTSFSGPARPTGTSTSPSKVVDFAAVAGLRTRP